MIFKMVVIVKLENLYWFSCRYVFLILIIKIIEEIIRLCFLLKLVWFLIIIWSLEEVIILNKRKEIFLIIGEGIDLIRVDSFFIKEKRMVKDVVLVKMYIE